MPMSMADSDLKARPGGNFMLEAYWQATDMQNASNMKLMDKWTRILAFEYAFQSPMDSSTGQATGRTKYNPICIQKLLDKSSPLIAQALTKNTLVKDSMIKIFETKSDGSGKVEKYNINMKDVRFIDIQVSSADAGIVETVKMAFRSVELKDNPSTIQTQLDWTENIH